MKNSPDTLTKWNGFDILRCLLQTLQEQDKRRILCEMLLAPETPRL
jgi:hypothetical protein